MAILLWLRTCLSIILLWRRQGVFTHCSGCVQQHVSLSDSTVCPLASCSCCSLYFFQDKRARNFIKRRIGTLRRAKGKMVSEARHAKEHT